MTPRSEPSAMVAAVLAELHKFDMKNPRTERIIAAILDHLPRHAMVEAALAENPWFSRREAERLVALIIAAAQDAIR